MPLFRLDPDMDRWRDDMMRVWNRMTQDIGGSLSANPNHFVVDAGDMVLVEVELPGVHPDQVELDADTESITIRGTWPESTMAIGGGLRRTGSFALTVGLPTDVDPDRANAHFHHGLLKVELPKAMGPRRRLPIQVAHDLDRPPLTSS